MEGSSDPTEKGRARITINHVLHHQNQDEALRSHAVNQIHQINVVIEPDIPSEVIVTSMRNTKPGLRDKRLYTRLPSIQFPYLGSPPYRSVRSFALEPIPHAVGEDGASETAKRYPTQLYHHN
jgi:hypothetical protein